MFNEEVKSLIDKKAVDLNSQGDLATYVASKIVTLNNYIAEKIQLPEKQIDNILSELVGFFTTSLYIPLEAGTKLLRARTYSVIHHEKDVSQLSYISNENRDKAKLGRLNIKNQPIYYGCICFSEKGGVNVAFSESNSKVGDTVNILHSDVIKDINVYYIGIYDHVHRQSKPRFMPAEMFEFYSSVHKYQEQQYTETVFLAHLLCDAFLSDILRRKESGKLYNITSKLMDIVSGNKDVDGVMYTSVKSEGAPVVALKTSTVDSKMSHKSCDCFRITNYYGYAQFRALHTHSGIIQGGNSIIWSKKN